MIPDRLAAALAARYRIVREVGAGGMAAVYLAEDLKHHRRVALKVLHPELAHAIGPDRFLREIETTAALHHPHILPLYDSGEADGRLHPVGYGPNRSHGWNRWRGARGATAGAGP
jgi:eukaryotic-like serine/threonine-protein kinase